MYEKYLLDFALASFYGVEELTRAALSCTAVFSKTRCESPAWTVTADRNTLAFVNYQVVITRGRDGTAHLGRTGRLLPLLRLLWDSFCAG